MTPQGKEIVDSLVEFYNTLKDESINVTFEFIGGPMDGTTMDLLPIGNYIRYPNTKHLYKRINDHQYIYYMDKG